MQKHQSKERTAWIDAIRVVACLMVIVLHVSAQMVVKYNEMDRLGWQIVNIFDSLVRPCVPLFFMVSGYIFLNDKNIKLRNVVRMVYCILFYSAVAVVYMLITNRFNALERVSNILEFPVFYHLWFFYSLFGCYLMFYFVKYSGTGGLKSILLISFVFILLNPVTYQVIALAGPYIKSRFFVDGSFIYLFLYSVVGAALGKIDTRRFGVLFPLLIFIVSSLFTSWLVYYHAGLLNKFNGTFYSNSSPIVFVSSIAIFITVKNYCAERKLNGMAAMIASLSLPIYGVHALVLDVMVRADFIDISNPILTTLFVFAIVFILSFVISYVIKYFDRKGFVT